MRSPFDSFWPSDTAFGALWSRSRYWRSRRAAIHKTGWLAYPPLSGILHSPDVGVDYYIWSLQIAGVGTLLSGVNLIAYSGFPEGRGAQLDFVPMDSMGFRDVAKRMKWKVKGPKRCFIIEGDDRIGACADVLGKLAAAKVNVVAMDAVAAGSGRWGAILWVAPRDVKKAAGVLGAM